MSNFKGLMKKKIINAAMKNPDFMNKPVLTGLKINNVIELIGGNFSYENAECVLTDNYTHPITHKQMKDAYHCVFNGELKIERIAA